MGSVKAVAVIAGNANVRGSLHFIQDPAGFSLFSSSFYRLYSLYRNNYEWLILLCIQGVPM